MSELRSECVGCDEVSSLGCLANVACRSRAGVLKMKAGDCGMRLLGGARLEKGCASAWSGCVLMYAAIECACAYSVVGCVHARAGVFVCVCAALCQGEML